MHTTVVYPEMFDLPHKPKLTYKVLQKRAQQLRDQYSFDAIRIEIQSKIDDLLRVPSDHYQKAQEILDGYSKEAATNIAWNLQYLPKRVQIKIAHLLLEKAPIEAAPNIASNLRYLPEGVRKEIAHLLLEKAPIEAAPNIASNLPYLPKEVQIKIARLLLEKAPKEAATNIAWNLQYLPEEVREEIENEVMQVVEVVEKEQLSQAEERNPVLYKGIDEWEDVFIRKKFPKTGTKTILLGKNFINNVILRIIPNSAFISWMDAYKATDTWKKEGFDYVPVEPIIKAHRSQDGKNTRVYSGVLGVNVSEYLDMYSNKKHHENVREQVEKMALFQKSV